MTPEAKKDLLVQICNVGVAVDELFAIVDRCGFPEGSKIRKSVAGISNYIAWIYKNFDTECSKLGGVQ